MISQCIHCQSKKIKKVGLTGKGKKRFKCLICNNFFQEGYIRSRPLKIELPAKVIIVTELVRQIRLAYEEKIFTETEINLLIPLLKEIKFSITT